MQTLLDNVYDNIAWWHPRHGELTVASLLTRAQHNGYPDATEDDITEVLYRLLNMGTITGGWF